MIAFTLAQIRLVARQIAREKVIYLVHGEVHAERIVLVSDLNGNALVEYFRRRVPAVVGRVYDRSRKVFRLVRIGVINGICKAYGQLDDVVVIPAGTVFCALFALRAVMHGRPLQLVEDRACIGVFRVLPVVHTDALDVVPFVLRHTDVVRVPLSAVRHENISVHEQQQIAVPLLQNCRLQIHVDELCVNQARPVLNRALIPNRELPDALDAEAGNEHGIVQEVDTRPETARAAQPLLRRVNARLYVIARIGRCMEVRQAVLLRIAFEHHERISNDHHARDRRYSYAVLHIVQNTEVRRIGKARAVPPAVKNVIRIARVSRKKDAVIVDSSKRAVGDERCNVVRLLCYA